MQGTPKPWVPASTAAGTSAVQVEPPHTPQELHRFIAREPQVGGPQFDELTACR